MSDAKEAPAAIVTAGSRAMGRACAVELAPQGLLVTAFAWGDDVAKLANELIRGAS